MFINWQIFISGGPRGRGAPRGRGGGGGGGGRR